MMHYCKLYLITRLFDFIANAGVDIIIFGAETFIKKIEVSCVTLVASKNPMNYSKNSQNRDFAELDNG